MNFFISISEDHRAVGLDAAVDQLAQARVLPMRAPGAGEPRITLTLPPIVQARHLYLHIEGADKREVLALAVSGSGNGGSLPVRQVLLQAALPVQVYWAA